MDNINRRIKILNDRKPFSNLKDVSNVCCNYLGDIIEKEYDCNARVYDIEFIQSNYVIVDYNTTSYTFNYKVFSYCVASDGTRKEYSSEESTLEVTFDKNDSYDNKVNHIDTSIIFEGETINTSVDVIQEGKPKEYCKLTVKTNIDGYVTINGNDYPTIENDEGYKVELDILNGSTVDIISPENDDNIEFLYSGISVSTNEINYSVEETDVLKEVSVLVKKAKKTTKYTSNTKKIDKITSDVSITLDTSINIEVGEYIEDTDTNLTWDIINSNFSLVDRNILKKSKTTKIRSFNIKSPSKIIGEDISDILKISDKESNYKSCNVNINKRGSGVTYTLTVNTNVEGIASANTKTSNIVNGKAEFPILESEKGEYTITVPTKEDIIPSVIKGKIISPITELVLDEINKSKGIYDLKAESGHTSGVTYTQGINTINIESTTSITVNTLSSITDEYITEVDLGDYTLSVEEPFIVSGKTVYCPIQNKTDIIKELTISSNGYNSTIVNVRMIGSGSTTTIQYKVEDISISYENILASGSMNSPVTPSIVYKVYKYTKVDDREEVKELVENYSKTNINFTFSCSNEAIKLDTEGGVKVASRGTVTGAVITLGTVTINAVTKENPYIGYTGTASTNIVQNENYLHNGENDEKYNINLSLSYNNNKLSHEIPSSGGVTPNMICSFEYRYKYDSGEYGEIQAQNITISK